MYIFGTLLTANGNFKILNILAAIALIINIGLNLWLIPIYKAYGAALAALCTQGFIGLSNFIIGKKKLDISFDKQFVLNFLVAILIISTCMYFSNYLNLLWWQTGIFLGITTLGLMFYLKFIDLEQAMNLIKSRSDEKSGI
jgi:O-antigen/teichoic acid export membrane protein